MRLSRLVEAEEKGADRGTTERLTANSPPKQPVSTAQQEAEKDVTEAEELKRQQEQDSFAKSEELAREESRRGFASWRNKNARRWAEEEVLAPKRAAITI